LIVDHVHKSKIAGLGLAVAATLTAAAGAGADEVCTVDDPRAVELSGLVATRDGYVSIVDSQWNTDTVIVVYLDASCHLVRTQGYPTTPRDPEDLAVAPDGALWVADIGDNATAESRRQTIALWRIPPGGGPAVIHRLTYPDGPHDAEALLFNGDGSPVVITKEFNETAYVYQATRPLEPNTAAGVPMRRAGELTATLVTGAATSPDRSRVAIRTYGQAYEWDVPDGDVVRAMTQGTPRITPLPDEPQGEAIAYTVDGEAFLTLSDEAGPTTIRRYARGTTTAGTPTAIATVSARSERPPQLWYLAGPAAVLLLGFVWLLARRRAR
jgi:DNA-binding beta-propeller fold protein YncE